jgi:hypothetical protein
VRRRQPTLSGCDEILEIDFFLKVIEIYLSGRKNQKYTPVAHGLDGGTCLWTLLAKQWATVWATGGLHINFHFFEFSTSKIENSSTPVTRSDRLCDPFLHGFVEDFAVASSNL